MRKIFYAATLLVAALLTLTACSNSPGDSEIKQALIERHQVEAGELQLFKLVNYTRVNGFEESNNRYLVEVSYDLEFVVSFEEVEALANAKEQDSFAEMETAMKLLSLKMKYGNFKQGDKRHKEQTITFYNTEKGWRLKG